VLRSCEKRNLALGGSRGIGDRLSRWLWLLQSEALCEEARRRTRLEDFGDPPVEPALSILVNSLELEADLHPLGRFLMRAHLRELLEMRLRLADAWRGRSESLEASVIRRPVFITGMPRSGSTFLHELLAEDSGNRVPRVWEVMFPIPDHNSPSSKVDPRVRKAGARLWWFRRLAPRADAVYPMRARTPHECVAIHSYTLLSEEFAMMCRIPSYEAFLRKVNHSPAYAWQKRFLQYLQLSVPAKQWILKSPDHVHSLEHLLTVFPDAAVIQTHRDPLDVLRSSIQVTEMLEGMFAPPYDQERTRIREVRSLAEHIEGITSFRDAHPELAGQFIDVNYSKLVSNPLAVVRRIYRQLDIRLTEGAVQRMQHLAGSRSRYKRPHANPNLKDLGLDEPTLMRRFEAYCSRFEIPCQQSELR
jgi:Sulfotransferase family